MSATIHCLVDTLAETGYMPEFGLSLFLETNGRRILFDTGAGEALIPNAARMGLDLNSATDIVLSHGHYDHTGGLAELDSPPQTPVYVGRGIAEPCWSLHDDGTKHRITMPPGSQGVLAKCQVHEIDAFTGIYPGIFLTGPIPRESGEDCGGHFFSDEACTTPNPIPEEQSLLLASGVLITGCCHAGIINTVEACRKVRPDIAIRTIVGGLHLRHASEERLERTAAYLASLGLERLVLMHCTGENAAEYLRSHLTCEVAMLPVGHRINL
jgi:7,8-dihydropterin-6-yl-methyl-4-(beta-D-ribofuranosyl)aminobenzene 5'-phosphate synthase